MLETLKDQVWEANMALPRHGLVTLTWGNVSAVDENREHLVIKPSGVAYADLRRDDLVVVRLKDGQVIEGGLKPSSDTPAHRVLYQAFAEVQSVVHTHSPWATAWAQAGRALPVLGTTHADFAQGPVPCTRDLSADEVAQDFEQHTAESIVEAFHSLDPLAIPAVLVRGHGPFCWGSDPRAAVEHAIILEAVAQMAYLTVSINPEASINQAIACRHFNRKHGPDAYYGQPG